MTGGPADGWRSSRPELAISAVFVGALAAAAYAWAGAYGAAVVLGACAVGILVLLRALPGPAPDRPAVPIADDWRYTGHRSITGFWRKRSMVKNATASMASYDHELRATLQHLLAARLAERHGISLYADPEAARRLLVASRRDETMWWWLDPARPPVPGDRPGIPPRTLAAILHRLEQL